MTWIVETTSDRRDFKMKKLLGLWPLPALPKSKMEMMKRFAVRKHTEDDRLDRELAAAVGNAIVNSRRRTRGCQDSIRPDSRKQSGSHAHGRHVRFVDECEKPAAPTQEAIGEPAHFESTSENIGNTASKLTNMETRLKLQPSNIVDLVLSDWTKAINSVIALGDLNGRSCLI